MVTCPSAKSYMPFTGRVSHHSFKITIILYQLLFICPSSTPAANDPVKLESLGVKRLNFSNSTEYYFSCNIKGPFLQIDLNGTPHARFQNDTKIHDYFVNEISNYVVTGILLSSEPVGNGNRAMSALIVVSFRSNEPPADFNVTCSNDTDSRTVQAGPVTNVTNSTAKMSDGNPDLVLDHIISVAFVENRQTHIFICGGANNDYLKLKGIHRWVGFSSNANLGQQRIASDNTTGLYELAILIRRNPFEFVSIFIVANDADVEVSCRNGKKIITRWSNSTHVKQESDTKTSSSSANTTLPEGKPPITTNSTVPNIKRNNARSSNTDRNRIVLHAAIAIVLFLVII